MHTVKLQANTLTFLLPLENFSSGIYIAVINDGETIFEKEKLVISR